MLDFDHDALVVPGDAELIANDNQIPYVEIIDLDDESISIGFRQPWSETSGVEFGRYVVQQYVDSLLSTWIQGEQLELNKISSVPEGIISNASAAQHGKLLTALLQHDQQDESRSVAARILDSIGWGTIFNNAEKAQFVDAAPDATSVVKALDPDSEQAEKFVRTVMGGKLANLVPGVEDLGQQLELLDPMISERDLIDVLKHIDSESRVQFAVEMFELAEANDEARQFVTAKTRNVLVQYTQDEREQIVDVLMSQEQVSGESIARVLQSSPNLESLNELITEAGLEKLKEIDNQLLKETLATSVILTGASAIEMPEHLEGEVTTQQIADSVRALHEALQARVEFIKDQEDFRDTRVGRELFETAMYEVEYLQVMENRVTSWEALGLLYEMSLTKSEISSRYGIALTHEEASFLTPGAHWMPDQLQAVKEALEEIPERLLLHTPMLTEIQRVGFLGPGVLGQRFDNGLIRIANYAVRNPGVTEAYDGIESLVVTLVHEIGHGIQLGKNSEVFVEAQAEDGSKSVVFGSGDPESDFNEYAELSGWTVITPDRWELTVDKTGIVIDGETHPIGQPVDHKGETLTFVINQGVLYSHDSEAPFSSVNYSRTNPWEDFAEAWAEYILLPERLIDVAPEKFKFLEQEFAKYGDRDDLQQKLKESLANKARGVAQESADQGESETSAPADSSATDVDEAA